MLSSDAVVIRNGKETMVSAALIVPGDAVVLSLGDKIPADLRVIEVSNMASAEAALPGEERGAEVRGYLGAGPGAFRWPSA